MRIETSIEVERDEGGPNWRHESVAVVGEVDLAAESVTIIEPDARFFSERVQDQMREELWLKALSRKAADVRAKALAADLFATGVALAKAVA